MSSIVVSGGCITLFHCFSFPSFFLSFLIFNLIYLMFRLPFFPGGSGVVSSIKSITAPPFARRQYLPFIYIVLIPIIVPPYSSVFIPFLLLSFTILVSIWNT